MKNNTWFVIFAVALLLLIGNVVFASDESVSRGISAELYPAGLKGVREVYLARQLCLSIEAGRLDRDVVVGMCYTPVKKISLPEPLDLLVKRRTFKMSTIFPAPLGYFIAYAPHGNAWLVTAWQGSWVTITRLKNVTDPADPKFSKLYWEEPWGNPDEPRFESQSRSLQDVLHKYVKFPSDWVAQKK